MTHEILRVTPTGDFVWHEDADRLIEEGDFTNSPSTQHILRALRKQRPSRSDMTWVGLTIEDKKEYISQDFGGSRTDAMDWTEKRIKEKNNGT